jgi:hypothetical protein
MWGKKIEATAGDVAEQLKILSEELTIANEKIKELEQSNTRLSKETQVYKYLSQT